MSSQIISKIQKSQRTQTFLLTQTPNIPRKWYHNQGSTVFNKTKNERGMAVEIRTTICQIFLNGCWRSSQIIWSTQNCLHPHTFLGTQIRNVLQKCTQEAQYFYSHPKKSKLGSMLAKQDCEGSLQKANWRSCTRAKKKVTLRDFSVP